MASTINASTSAGLISSGDTSGVLALQTNSGTTAVTIDTSQNVGIGTSSPSYKLQISGTTSTDANNLLTGAQFVTNGIAIRQRGNSAGISGVTYAKQIYSAGSPDVMEIYNAANYALVFGANATEGMRLDNNNNLLVGTTTAGTGSGSDGVGITLFNNGASEFVRNGGGASVVYIQNKSSGSTGLVGFFSNSSFVGSISYNGSLVLYNQTSDQRLKENIVDSGTALETIGQIKIRAFDWIASKKHETHGVVAQELKEIAPQCVTEGTNHEDGSIDTPWQVDTSPLVPMLVKAIQELKAINDTQAETINALTARIVALEAK